jgi:hypothetical protein
MPDDPNDEIVVSLNRLIDQAKGDEGPATARIKAAVTAKTYLDALTRRLVNEAREDGTSWDDIALIFGTSPVNAKARWGDYNDYDDT